MENYVKIWILSLLKILIRNGKKIHYIKIVEKFIIKILNLQSKISIYNFFINIKTNMFLPLYLRTRFVAGRKVLIPVPFENLQKEISFILRIILKSSKTRSERGFENRLFNEFLDVLGNKGISIKKRNQICFDIKENLPNIRFLRYK